MGGQDRIEDEAPGVADFVAVRVGEFADQSVSSEQPQIAADGAGGPAFLVWFFGGEE